MSKRTPLLLLEDMLEATQNVFDYTKGLTFEMFEQDRKTRDAVVRNFEVIGEAANNLPDEIFQQFPEVDWSGVVGFRNVLIHNYFGVDYSVVWNIKERDLQHLKEQLEQIVFSLKSK